MSHSPVACVGEEIQQFQLTSSSGDGDHVRARTLCASLTGEENVSVKDMNCMFTKTHVFSETAPVPIIS